MLDSDCLYGSVVIDWYQSLMLSGVPLEVSDELTQG